MEVRARGLPGGGPLFLCMTGEDCFTFPALSDGAVLWVRCDFMFSARLWLVTLMSHQIADFVSLMKHAPC